MSIPPAPEQVRPISVNRGSRPLVERLRAEAQALGVVVRPGALGCTIIDAGVAAPGGVDAGIVIAEICMGGLGRVRLSSQSRSFWPTHLEVTSAQPVLACLASQYAGWSLSASAEQTGAKKYSAMGSGPARALAIKEPLFAELGYHDRADNGCLVLETAREPPAAIIDKVLRDCALTADQLTVILTPTQSLAGTTQIVARVLEVALHKAHVLKFPLERIVHGTATAPLPTPAPDVVEAMGRTNDAILYGGCVHLTVSGDDAAARELAQQLPSSTSRDYGRAFAEIFREVEFDFYRIDPSLFAPAEVWVSNRDTGRSWQRGRVDVDLLERAWRSDLQDLQ